MAAMRTLDSGEADILNDRLSHYGAADATGSISDVLVRGRAIIRVVLISNFYRQRSRELHPCLRATLAPSRPWRVVHGAHAPA